MELDGLLQLGSVFAGDFRVVRKLAAGGMGAVYLAEQISTGRQRALKIMQASLVGSAELREKFGLEARVGARIASDHVVEVVGAGVDAATGIPWLAMELLVGDDLSAVIKARAPLGREEVVSIVGQICHALSAAHTAGIVHRDLKPENVFLAESRRAHGATTVKLLDFGIAKVLEAARGWNTGALGSPLWMAPEQTERDVRISPSTDVWSLGLVAFAMFTGKPFWLAATAGDLALSAFLRELVLDPIPTASERARELGAPAPPAGFDAWFARCVDRDREARFPDARAAYLALVEALGVAPDASITFTTGPIPVRVSAPTASASAPDAFAAARTVPHTPAALASERPPEADEAVPVSRPPFRLLAVGAVVAVLAVGGFFAFYRQGTTGGARDDAGVRTAGEVYCAKGTSRVPAGTITMAEEGKPSQSVDINAFCMDLTEVTAGEYDECVTRGACAKIPAHADWSGLAKADRDMWSAYCNRDKPNRREHPMNCVTFEEAAAYCQAQGKRLPTEPEWELAARGADNRAFPWGHEPPAPSRLNACDDGCARNARQAMRGSVELLGPRLTGDDGHEGSAPVGTFPAGAGPYGMFDLAGNVAEWVDASFCPYGQSACGTSARVARGGSWLSETPTAVKTTTRVRTVPSTRSPDLGFRCVK